MTKPSPLPLRPRCVNCGKPAGLVTDREDMRIVGEPGEGPPPLPVYEGPKTIIRQQGVRSLEHTPKGEAQHVLWFTRWLWAGRWKPLYGDLFCTLRCALAYAEWAYEQMGRR